jgi:hypothetical protein
MHVWLMDDDGLPLEPQHTACKLGPPFLY